MRNFVLLFLLSPALQAQSSSGLMDYAWQATLDESSSLLQRVELPLSLMQNLTHLQAADVAVFDASGQKLPSLMRKTPARVEIREVDLRFHRFTQRRPLAGVSQSMMLNKQHLDSDKQQIIELRYLQSLPAESQQADYIIQLDDEQVKKDIRAISLSWSHQPADALLQVKVQTANDLDHWSTLYDSKNLYDKDGRIPEWVRIDGLPGNSRYIRISAKHSMNEFTLHQVTGHYQQRETPDLLWWPTDQTLQADPRHADYLYFKQPFSVSASALRFRLPVGFFLTGDLYAGGAEFEDRKLIKAQLNLQQIDQLEQSQTTLLPARNYQHWWFKPSQALSIPVNLEWGYAQYELLFINNRQGPFTLAWGNYAITEVDRRLLALLKSEPDLNLEEAASVAFHSVKPAGGESRMREPAHWPWRIWLLWFVLLVAVAITARMALVLYRDMQRT